MRHIIWIANKLKLNGSASGANSTGMAIAICGVAVAIIIMECTLGIVLGFKNQITDRIVGFDGEICLLPAYYPSTGQSDAYISLTPQLFETISDELPSSKAVERFTLPGILKTDEDFVGIYLNGYGKNYDQRFIEENLADGAWPDFSEKESQNDIVISSKVSDAMQLAVGDKVMAYFFIDEAVKARKFSIAGIYDTGFADYDQVTAFAAMATLRKIAGADSLSATKINISVPSIAEIQDRASDLQNKLVDMYQADQIDKLYPVDNVKHTGALFFNWLDLLDTNVVVIFVLMACVACFTLVSSMFILVLDRIPTIGMFRALGENKRSIRMLFSFMAMRVVAYGMLIGNAIGLGLLLAQEHLKILKLNADMYYLPYVPVEINWWWMLWLNAGVMAVAWCVLVIPAKAASDVSPAASIRFD